MQPPICPTSFNARYRHLANVTETQELRSVAELSPWKMDQKLKSENMQKQQFSMFTLYFESNRGRQM